MNNQKPKNIGNLIQADAKVASPSTATTSCEPVACNPNSCSDVTCRDGFSLEPQHLFHVGPLKPQSSDSSPMLPLSGGTPGDRYTVIRLCSNHLSAQDDDLKRRLQMYGVVPGTELIIDRIAPLGDPITLRVRGTELALRRREAACIIVVPYSATSSAGITAANAQGRCGDTTEGKVASNF